MIILLFLSLFSTVFSLHGTRLKKRDPTIDVSLSQQELNNFNSQPGSAQFWEQSGFVAISNARQAKPFDYSKYVDSKNSVGLSALTQDYPDISSFLGVCIFGAIVCAIGSIVMCACCVMREPRQIDPDDVSTKKKIFFIVLLFIVSMLSIFFIFLTLSSLNDFVTGMKNANAATGSIVTSGTSMLKSSQNDLSAILKSQSVDTSIYSEFMANITGKIQNMNSRTSDDVLNIDMYMDDYKNSALKLKVIGDWIIGNSSFIYNGREDLSENFNSTMFKLNELNANSFDFNVPDGQGGFYVNTYQLRAPKPFVYFQTANLYYFDTFDNSSALQLATCPNIYNVHVPKEMLGAAIKSKIANLTLKANVSLSSTNSSIYDIYKTAQSTLQYLFSNGTSTNNVAAHYSAFSAASTAYTTTVNTQTTLIYVYFGILFFLLISMVLASSVKIPKLAMGTLCGFLFLIILCFVFSFVYYILAFMAGENCANLNSNFEALKLVNPTVADYTQSGLSANDLCARNLSVSEVLQDPSISALLPDQFNQTTFNISSLIANLTAAKNLSFIEFQNEIKAAAFNDQELSTFLSIFQTVDPQPLNATGKLMGELKWNINTSLFNGFTTLNNTVYYTESDIKDISSSQGPTNSADDLGNWKLRVTPRYQAVKNFKNTFENFNTSRSYVYINSDAVFPLLDHILNTSYFANMLYPNVTNNYALVLLDAQAESPKYFKTLMANLTKVLESQLEKGFKSNNCHSIGLGVDAMKTSFCSVALYGLNGMWLSFVVLGFCLIVQVACIFTVYLYLNPAIIK
eukprot:NODE_506_length_6690_cov_0.762858.p1 type:complete len:798 gc:universal NODE_506_length_6690_cov_0.762858:2913-5306(+)